MTAKRYKVAILGATGMVGQKLVQLLDGHPWFEVAALAASAQSAGRQYGEAVRWRFSEPMPAWASGMTIVECRPEAVGGVDIAFSALDSAAAGDIEVAFAEAGIAVVTNASSHRMDVDVPLVIPEVNPTHLALLSEQRRRRGWEKGCIVANPNCSVAGLVVALAPLHRKFGGISRVDVTTLQAVSGAGHSGVASLDIIDNVIPYIDGEEEKVRREPRKILGSHVLGGGISPADIRIDAHCNRVPVLDGHLACVSMEFRHQDDVQREHVLAAWREFALPASLALPSCPDQVIEYREEADRPQPRFDRNAGLGMTVSVGRLRAGCACNWKFVVLSHNLVRGAAGAAKANAELLVATGYV